MTAFMYCSSSLSSCLFYASETYRTVLNGIGIDCSGRNIIFLRDCRDDPVATSIAAAYFAAIRLTSELELNCNETRYEAY